jgi:hypothetical protein
MLIGEKPIRGITVEEAGEEPHEELGTLAEALQAAGAAKVARGANLITRLLRTILRQSRRLEWWVRVVFQKDQPDPSHYRGALALLGKKQVNRLGLPVDSEPKLQLSKEDYERRCKLYKKVLDRGRLVDCWEIGNESNGTWNWNPEDPRKPWVGPKCAQEVRDRVEWAFHHFSGKPRLLTLYIDENNSEIDPELWSPWMWSEKLPARVRDGIEWVGFSYYRDHQPVTWWSAQLAECRKRFPHAKFLISECGFDKNRPSRECDSALPSSLDRQHRERWMHYYNCTLPQLEGKKEPRFIGGGFWWHGWADRRCIPIWIREA